MTSYFSLVILYAMCLIIGQMQLIHKPPTFFHTQYFTLGSQPATASGNFAIPFNIALSNVTKLQISLVELRKATYRFVKFSSKITSSTSGSISSLTLLVNYNTPSTFLLLSWFAVAIMNIGTNVWVDMVSFQLLNDGSNTIKAADPIQRVQQFTVDYSANTVFNVGTAGLNSLPFLTCFEADFGSAGATQIQFSLDSVVLNTTHLSAGLTVEISIAMYTFRGFVVIYNKALVISLSGYLEDNPPPILGSNLLLNVDANYPNWGPKFAPQCFYGFFQINYWNNQGFNIYISWSGAQSFMYIAESDPNSANNLFKFNFFCISDGTWYCGQSLRFYDQGTNTCYAATSCPIPTVDNGPPYNYPTCLACYEIDCLNCTAADKNYCTVCDPTKFSHNVSGDCACDTNYVRQNSTVYCQPNCTFLITGCQEFNCTNSDFCSSCLPDYYFLTVDVTHQTCQKCNDSLPGCDNCTGFNHCTACLDGFYKNNWSAIQSGITVNYANCTPCQDNITYCATCTSISNCLTCDLGYNVSGSTLCVCDFNLITNCISCLIANQCTNCTTGYFVLPATKQCLLCTNLSNCLTCTAFDTCTSCTDLHALSFDNATNATTCQDCSFLITNCFNCTSSTVCIACIQFYGVDINSSCTLCLTLLDYCSECADYTACQVCQNHSLIFYWSGACTNCTEQITYCTSCSQNTSTGVLTCLSCQPGYYVDTVLNQCVKCGNSIYDCLECTFNAITLLPECFNCSALFLVDTNFTCQICKIDKYVTRTCTNVSGCSSSQSIGGKNICLSCDSIKNFQYNPKKKDCQCQYGFTLDKSIQTCLSKCGDGIKVGNQLCDDGNQLNNDGCSQVCIMQSGFDCDSVDGGITTCALIADISIVFEHIIKNLQKNQASLYFTVSPASTTLNKVDWSKTISFDFSLVTKRTFQYSDGILIITVEYSGSIDDQLLNLQINFDPSLLISPNQTLSLRLNALNGPLSYSDTDDSTSSANIKIGGIIVGAVCLALLLLASYFHKLIGLQTIQFIQLIYFSRILMTHVPFSSFHAFNSLKYSNGYNLIQSSSAVSKSSSLKMYKALDPKFTRIQMSLQFLQNCNLMLGLVGLVGLAFVLFLLRKSYLRSKFMETKDRQYKDKFTIALRTVNWLYDNCIFSFTLALLYLSIFSAIIALTSKTASHSHTLFTVLSFSSLLLLSFLIFCIFSFQFLNGIQKFIDILNPDENQVRSTENDLNHEANTMDNGCHPIYVSVYLGNQVVVLSLVIVTFSGWQWTGECLTLVQGCYLVLILIWRPYLLKIHNLAIILNQFTACMFLMVLVGLEYNLVNSQLFSILSYCILSLIGVCLLLQFVRIYIHKKYQMTNRQSKSSFIAKPNELAPISIEGTFQNTNIYQPILKNLRSFIQAERSNVKHQAQLNPKIQKQKMQIKEKQLWQRDPNKNKQLTTEVQRLQDIKKRMRSQFHFMQD